MSDLHYIIGRLPAAVPVLKRVDTACFIASVLGPCSQTLNGGGETVHAAARWEVLWESNVNAYGVWLSPQGVYISDEIDEAPTYQIIGYCALQGIPWFTDNTVAQLAQSEGETKQ